MLGLTVKGVIMRKNAKVAFYIVLCAIHCTGVEQPVARRMAC